MESIMKTRKESDFLGAVKVPDNVYYGVQTIRAIENFQISSTKLNDFPVLIKSCAQVKQAAARANYELGLLSKKIAIAIDKSCEEVKAGNFDDQFIIDMFQGGAGTSINMNVNEVIANRALELLGKKKGEYKYCHPNNHINLCQSTNDAYPSALRLAIYYELDTLLGALRNLYTTIREKANQWYGIIKMGRTQLQDAVPMTFGQEFGAFESSLRKEELFLINTFKYLLELNMGGTAIGTGINSHPNFSSVCIKHLKDITLLPVSLTSDMIEASWDTRALVSVSSSLKQLAIKLSKISKDLRLLSSGPQCGFNEINLPRLQPGSSIMPGKVNPVIPEVVNQISFRVISNDFITTMASESGQLQLNVMEPVIVLGLFESISLLSKGMIALNEKCMKGITINKEICENHVKHSAAIVTALNPVIGYDEAAQIAKEAQKTGESVYNLVLKHNILEEEVLQGLLKPENMTKPNMRNNLEEAE